MMERTETTNKIEWYRNFYKWQRVDDFKFTLEELVELNKGLTFTKYDPEIISRHAFISSALIGVFPGFDLYQFDESALYRTYPIRVIHSKKYRKTFELDGTNAPLYDLMEFIKPNIADISTWLKDEAVKYVMLFLDNVKGKHGRFAVIDFAMDPLIQIKNRVNNFYRLDLGLRSRQENATVMSLQHTGFKNNFELPDEWQEFVFPAIEEAFARLFEHKRMRIIEFDGEKVVIELCIVFAAALFSAQVVVSGDEESFGNIRLQNEELSLVSIRRKNNGKYYAAFIAADIAPSSTDQRPELPKTDDTEVFQTDKLPYFP